MTIETLFIIVSALLLISTLVFVWLWRGAVAKQKEYRQKSEDYDKICELAKTCDPDKSATEVMEELIKVWKTYAPIMDFLVVARKELKEAAESPASYPHNAIGIINCIAANEVLWTKQVRDDEEAGKAFRERLVNIAGQIKDTYKPAEAESVGLLVKDHIRPLLESLPNYRAFGENERNQILHDVLALAFATIDAMLYTRQADPDNNDNLLQMKLLRGEITQEGALEAARKVTPLESETPLWAIRLNILLQDLADKYGMPKSSLYLKGYRFEIGA